MAKQLYTHPDFDELDQDWQVYHDLFKGNHKTLSSERYLIKHELENKEGVEGSHTIRNIREKRSFYTNHSKRIFRRYCGLIFQNPAIIDSKTLELFGDNIHNLDGEKNGIDEFLKKKVFKERFLYGRAFIKTDGFIENNNRPFWQTLKTRDVKDWQYSETKDLEFIRYEYDFIEPRLNAEQKPQVNTYSDVFEKINGQIVFNKYKHEADSKKWELVDSFIVNEANGSFKRILIASIIDGESFLTEVAPETLDYHNAKSMHRNVILYHGVPRTVFTGNFDDNNQRIALSEYTGIFVNDAQSVDFVEPSNPIALKETIQSAELNVMLAAFHLTRAVSSDSKQVEGADTLDKAKEDLLKIIKTEILSLEDLINQAVRDWAYFQTGKDNFEPQIVLNKDVKIEDIDKELAQELAYIDRLKELSPTGYKELIKKAVKRMSLPDQEQIEKEINDSELNNQTNQASARISEFLNEQE